MKSEAAVQSEIRIEAPKRNVTLFRNNVGVGVNPAGVPIRFGLCNDSAKLNRKFKSSDLIGFRPLDMFGQTVAQFVAIECKREGWVWADTDREVAQLAYLNIVRAAGGVGEFCTSVEEFIAALKTR